MLDTARSWFGTHRKPALAALFVAAAVLLGLVLAWRGEFRGKYAVPTAGHDSALSLAPPPIATPTPRPAVASAARPAITAPAPPEATDAADGGDDDARQSTEDAQDDQRRIARAIDHAVHKALRRGETVRWHKAGQEGFVMVSEARDDPDRTCRNVTATVLDGHGQTLSNAHLWCTPIYDDDWQPVP
jgi:surface antigen